MCRLCHDPNRILLAQGEEPPPINQTIQTQIQEFNTVLANWHSSIVEALGSLGVDLAAEGAVRIAVEHITDEHRQTWTTVIEDTWTDGAEAGRSAAISRHDLDISWELTDPQVVRALKEYGKRAAEQIQRRMTGDVATAIVEGYQAGYGVDEIAATLQDEVFPDMRGYEARRVARTEGISASNRGRQTGFEDANIPFQRWMSRDDNDTRPTHIEADNQIVPVGSTFTVGGHQARFPGDPNLPPEERINCRCLILPEREPPKHLSVGGHSHEFSTTAHA